MTTTLKSLTSSVNKVRLPIYCGHVDSGGGLDLRALTVIYKNDVTCSIYSPIKKRGMILSLDDVKISGAASEQAAASLCKWHDDLLPSMSLLLLCKRDSRRWVRLYLIRERAVVLLDEFAFLQL